MPGGAAAQPGMVGGLRTAVREGYSGVLVEGHDPVVWARVLTGLLASPGRVAALSRGAGARVRLRLADDGRPADGGVHRGHEFRPVRCLPEREGGEAVFPSCLTAAHD